MNIGIQKAFWKIPIITTNVEHTPLLSGIKENAPICYWKVEICLKESSQAECETWCEQPGAVPGKQEVSVSKGHTSSDRRDTGSPQTEFLWGLFCCLWGEWVALEEISQERAALNCSLAELPLVHGHTTELQSSLRIMNKGSFAAGHVGVYLFLQRLHWTCKKSSISHQQSI